jgi:hypothetical protein
VRLLCYVNHYFGRAVGWEGLAQPRSTTGDDGQRRLIVAACLDALRALPGAEVNVCGIAGNALETIDIDFSQALSDPRMLPFESLAHMARRVDDYDYFINIEDDILVPPETFANVVAFDQESLVNEVLHPNRIEEDETGRVSCVDLKAIRGWTYQRRTYRGREIRVALNPHSAVLILSRDKLRYALRYVDVSFRGPYLSSPTESALAYYLSPFSLFRPYEDLGYHTVTHLDRYIARVPQATSVIAKPKPARWKTVVRDVTPPILLPRRRRKG